MFTKATHRVTDDITSLRESAEQYYNNKLYEESFATYKRASELGDSLSDIKLSNFYYSGISVEKSYEKAFEYMNKAAENEIPEAMYYTGVFYYTGLGIDQNRKKAHKLMKQAANKKYEKAKTFLKTHNF